MTDMIERVARALCAEDTEGRQFEVCRSDFESMARAAIEAMREPTEAMVESGANARTPDGFLIGVADATEAWQAMIDAALGKEKAT